MPVIQNDTVQRFDLPGLVHQTVAGPEHGYSPVKEGTRHVTQEDALWQVRLKR